MIVMYHFLVKSLFFSFVIIIILAERKVHIRGCYFFPFLGNSDSIIKTGRSPVYNAVLPVMYVMYQSGTRSLSSRISASCSKRGFGINFVMNSHIV